LRNDLCSILKKNLAKEAKLLTRWQCARECDLLNLKGHGLLRSITRPLAVQNGVCPPTTLSAKLNRSLVLIRVCFLVEKGKMENRKIPQVVSQNRLEE
jgi:hypothetical protein